MHEIPTVSVIIPNYNHAPYLRERIDSVLNQTWQDFEIILLDDHSTDGSPDIMNEYKSNPHINHIVINTENSGNTFQQWERGIKLARGKYVWIAESDDVAERQFLETLMNELLKKPQATVAYSHSTMIDANSQRMSMTWHRKGSSGKVNTFEGSRFVKEKMLARNHIYNASMAVFSRASIENVPFDYQQYSYCGDWLFWVYICRQGQVIEVCKPLNRYRQHIDKVSNKANFDGRTWSNTAGVISTFISIFNLNTLQCRCIRGKYTKRYRKHERTIHHKFQDKLFVQQNGNSNIIQSFHCIRQQYPEIYGGTTFDICLYEICKIFGFLTKD